MALYIKVTSSKITERHKHIFSKKEIEGINKIKYPMYCKVLPKQTIETPFGRIGCEWFTFK